MAQVIPLLRAWCGPGHGDWTQQERAELARTAAEYARRDHHAIVEGTAEDGTPWFAVIDRHTGSTVFHVAKEAGWFHILHGPSGIFDNGPELRIALARLPPPATVPTLFGALAFALPHQLFEAAPARAAAPTADGSNETATGPGGSVRSPDALVWHGWSLVGRHATQPPWIMVPPTFEANVWAQGAAAVAAREIAIAPMLSQPEPAAPLSLPPVALPAPPTSWAEPTDLVVVGGPGPDRLAGGSGDDVLIGGAGRDTLSGGAGDDRLILDGGDVGEGGSGADRFEIDLTSTEAGDVTITDFEPGTDSIVLRLGGHAVQMLDLSAALTGEPSSFTVELRSPGLAPRQLHISTPGRAAPETRTATTQDDVVRGRIADEIIEGRAGDDTLTGGGGDDSIVGGVGDDNLRGGQGNDTLVGGAGADVLSGGAGRDVFRWSGAQDRGDLITDFSGEDRLELRRSGFGWSGADLPEHGFVDVRTDEPTSAEPVLLWDGTTGQLWFDLDGRDYLAPVLMASFRGGAVVTADSFQLIG